jgi:beta-aspartyl-peptidase (threonine type)
MKKLVSWLILLGLAAGPAFPAASQTQAEKDILDILEKQKTSWNDRDIEGFMAFYWKSAEFTFQSAQNRLRGWDALLQRYRKSYSGENWERLDFTDLEIRVLAEDCAYVLGRWRLGSGEKSREGMFTIVLKRFPEGWRIIHDQSC